MISKTAKNERGVYSKGKMYYIHHYANGTRKRVAVGKSLQLVSKTLAKNKIEAKDERMFDIKRDSVMLFDDIVKDYIVFVAKEKKSFWYYMRSIWHLMKEFQGSKLIDISREKIEEYRKIMLKAGSSSFINKEMVLMKNIYNLAIKNKKASYNPVSEVKLLPPVNRGIRHLKYCEIKRIINACSKHLRPFVLTALITGMRWREIAALKWDDVDLAKKSILIQSPMSRKKRLLPICNLLYKVLKNCLKWTDGQYVFCNKYKKPYSTHIRPNLSKALEEAGIDNLGFYSVRISVASYLRKVKVGPAIIMAILGIETIGNNHLSQKHIKNALNKLENFTEKAMAGEPESEEVLCA